MDTTDTNYEETVERTRCCTAVPQIVQAGASNQMYPSCPICGKQNPGTKDVPIERAQRIWEERHPPEESEPDGIVARAKSAVARLT